MLRYSEDVKVSVQCSSLLFSSFPHSSFPLSHLTLLIWGGGGGKRAMETCTWTKMDVFPSIFCLRLLLLLASWMVWLVLTSMSDSHDLKFMGSPILSYPGTVRPGIFPEPDILPLSPDKATTLPCGSLNLYQLYCLHKSRKPCAGLPRMERVFGWWCLSPLPVSSLPGPDPHLCKQTLGSDAEWLVHAGPAGLWVTTNMPCSMFETLWAGTAIAVPDQVLVWIVLWVTLGLSPSQL